MLGSLFTPWMSHAANLRKWGRWTQRIRRQETRFAMLADDDLRKESLDLRWRARELEPLDALLPTAFALVCEAAGRTLGMRHFDVQMIAGCALHAGYIAEMETGEGKTLMASLPSYLNALIGQGVHVVTVNDYLASRDAAMMGPMYAALGLSVGCLRAGMNPDVRRQEYAKDITYGTAQEFAFDFLRDRLAADAQGLGQLGKLLFRQQGTGSEQVQRGLHFAIVDEADSILIDSARTPLIISAAAEDEDEDRAVCFRWGAETARMMRKDDDFTYDRATRKVELTAEGRWRLRAIPLPPPLRRVAMDELFEYVTRAVKALRDYRRDEHYVVRDGEIQIVDEFTGRVLPGRKWRDGIHQAIEAQEGIRITADTQQAARITIQQYFGRYQKLTGMTGTALNSQSELKAVYKTHVVRIPTNRPCRRRRERDRVFPTEQRKWDAVVNEIERRHGTGQPILIGTRSIEKSELLSQLLELRGIEHHVLNAKNHAQEAEIIADAGQKGAVTIATNMAGRGVDIKLGPGVAELGGLHVLGTERHESARIDRQLEGRSGRQGDPGSARFWLSLEDELLRSLKPRQERRLLARRASKRRRSEWAWDRNVKFFLLAQHQLEKKHAKERSQLMYFEKLRGERQETMGLDPFLFSME